MPPKDIVTKVAVMQPYIFPYIGYFQLVNAVDTFVFGDDVNFIKGGFINRNRILVNNEAYLVSFPCLKRSQNKLIKEVEIKMGSKDYINILKTIKQAYYKAPNFEEIFPILESIFDADFKNISELASNTVVSISAYLEIETNFLYSSINFGHTTGQDKSKRLIQITKELGSTHYINAIGGKEIYDKKYFENHGVTLNFLKSQNMPYRQFNNDFITDLSIIDVLMFNSVEEIKEMLNKYFLS